MHTSPTRILCASAGALLLLSAAALTRSAVPGVFLALLVAGGFLLMIPGTLAATGVEEDSRRRFGFAALLCFSVAAVLSALASSVSSRAVLLATQLATLGLAFWSVSMLLAFATAWCWTQRTE
jgi:hypothetical protein